MSTGKKKNTKQKKKNSTAEMDDQLIQWVKVIILLSLTLIGLLKAGIVGTFFYNLFRYVFGDTFYLILLIAVFWYLISIASNYKDASDAKNPVPILLISLDILLLSAYLACSKNGTGFGALQPFYTNVSQYFVSDVQMSLGGGIVGTLLYALSTTAIGLSGTVIFMIAVFIIATVLMGFMDVYRNAFSYVVDFFKTPESEEKEEIIEEEPKEKPNLWKMIETHKSKKANFIEADGDAVEEQDLNEVQQKLDKGEEVVIRFKPKMTTAPERSKIDIRADKDEGDTHEILLLSETDSLENTLKLQRPLSAQSNIFISVDDLQDTTTPDEEEEFYPSHTCEEVVEETVPPVIEEESEPIEEEPVPQPTVTPVVKENREEKSQTKASTNYANYRRPNPMRVLDPIPPKNGKGENEASAKRRGEALVHALATFDIPSVVKDIHIGPSVTQFEVKPDETVKVSKILGLADNLKMQLEAKDIRIEAPIPGKNAVGIEIPNEKSTPVKMKELVGSLSDKEKEQPLLFFLGKDLLGQPVTCRIDKMPHLLIAGATGSGKSVCMNSLICSLLLRTRPDQVKMLLIDPKKVEFTPYQKIPHLIGPVINDPNKANNALKVIVRIMDERYNLFAMNNVRNIAGYHAMLESKPQDERQRMDPMPYIVVIVDELADLMLVAGKEVEASIQRLTQLARAAGIHLVIATQRPSSDVITGVIKANIPSRIAFSVSSSIDSRVILDHVGAERLLGNGDMLYMPIGANSAQRIQGVFVTDEEVQRICDSLSAWAPHYDDSFILLEGVNDVDGAPTTGVSEDPMYQEVKDYVVRAQRASTSALQRQFGIGYNRAARMIDELERTGIIGPAQGSKPRDVYMKPEDLDK